MLGRKSIPSSTTYPKISSNGLFLTKIWRFSGRKWCFHYFASFDNFRIWLFFHRCLNLILRRKEINCSYKMTIKSWSSLY